MHWRDIIRRPVITEKTNTMASDLNQYTFVVHARANKIQIREAVELAFPDVSVVKVRVMNMPSKRARRFRRQHAARRRQAPNQAGQRGRRQTRQRPVKQHPVGLMGLDRGEQAQGVGRFRHDLQAVAQLQSLPHRGASARPIVGYDNKHGYPFQWRPITGLRETS